MAQHSVHSNRTDSHPPSTVRSCRSPSVPNAEFLCLSAGARHRRIEYRSPRSGRPAAPPRGAVRHCGTHRGWSRRGLARDHERSGCSRGVRRGHGRGRSAVPADDRRPGGRCILRRPASASAARRPDIGRLILAPGQRTSGRLPAMPRPPARRQVAGAGSSSCCRPPAMPAICVFARTAWHGCGALH